MLPQNIINTEKRNKINGRVLHLFYKDLNTIVLFDSDLNVPIAWGSKTVIVGYLKKINLEMNVSDTTTVRIYSYILDPTNGFRKIQTYNGPISGIGKYLIRY